jgi:hypothetical protein
VHLFVFYYGIMGDITPPVGLASFAAAAISGEDPIDTGVQGAVYALRTVILPFVWIFNPALLLIGVNGWFSLAVVVVGSTIACLVFAAATMGWFQTKNRWWETLLLLLAVFMLFRPNFFMDRIYNPYVDRAASEVYEVAKSLPEDSNLIVVLEGTNIEGDDIRKTVSVRLTKPGDGRVRLRDAGLTLTVFGEEVRIGTVRFGSRAKRGGFEQGWKIVAIKTPANTPSDYWVFIPALAIIALVFFNQRRRASQAPPAGRTVPA